MELINEIRKIREFFEGLSVEEFEQMIIEAGANEIKYCEDEGYKMITDNVKVVRCKDCVHSRKFIKSITTEKTTYHRYCELFYPDLGFKDDDYCSYGERKDK